MKRKTDTQISPQKLFDSVLYSPIHWPWKTVCLERNSLTDYQQRSVSANLSVAELYHENSKLFFQMLPELTAMRLKTDEVISEFVRRRSDAARSSCALSLDIGRQERELLSMVTKTTEPELFYAIEMRIIAGEILALHEPASDTLRVLKRISSSDLDVLRKAVHIMVDPEASQHDGALLFIIGCFSRNDMLFGHRGYRRTLLEAGQIVQEVIRQAKLLDLIVRPVFEFIDHDLDTILEVDGLEEGTLVAFELGGIDNVCQGRSQKGY